MSGPVYRWRVTPPARLKASPVEVTGPRCYEAIIAAAKIWRVPWTSVAKESTFEKLGEVEA